MIARVALSGAVFSMDKLYDYRVPSALAESVAPGKRVSVPFGRGNRRREGMVFSLGEDTPRGELKELDGVLDELPILEEGSLRLAEWMKRRFFCTYYEAVKAMLPAGIWLKAREMCRLTDPAKKEEAYLAAGEDGNAKAILDSLYASEGGCPADDLRDAFGKSAEGALKLLTEAGVIRLTADIRQAVPDKLETIAALAISAEEAYSVSEGKRKRAPQQAELLRLLSEMGEAGVKELLYFTGAGIGSIRALEKAGLITLRKEEVFRRPEYTAGDKPRLDRLNGEQTAAFEGLSELLRQEEAAGALLYGVTGSGKTAVYIRLIREALSLGRRALVLVPEIALTPQLVATFYQHFGERVAVLHSSLTVAQRYDEWKRIREGLVDVAVGTRSAVFAPLKDLGLIILDEEQENTYQSENAPRYHARDVAKFRCVHRKALLVLGSATPSVETMYEAQRGRLKLFRLRERFNERALPRVSIVDMKEELRGGNGSCISAFLREELSENLRRGEQSILFLNRRGSSSVVSCPECGFTFSCPHCSVKMTYHAANSRFMCHWCGHSQPMTRRCPECGGILNYGGLGTQKAEEELLALFPDVGILRMDTDTVSAAHPHQELLNRFEKERIPILLGTQMVTKGLNFENVTLVGVLSADQSLYAGDYRAQERTFSLITQVVGRSGRGSLPGRAVIQTYTPESEVIRCASRQDYDAFYASEIQTRELLSAPPFRAIYALTVTGTEEGKVLRCVTQLREALASSAAAMPEVRVLGPAPAGVLRVNERFRYRVILTSPPSGEVRALTAGALRSFSSDSRYRDLAFYGTVDPLD